MSNTVRRHIEAAPGAVTADLARSGFHRFGGGVHHKRRLACMISSSGGRRFDESLFLSEAEFDADPQYTGVNPRPGRHLLESFQEKMDFVEADGEIVRALDEVFGSDHEIVLKKLICGVPASDIPSWVRQRIEGNPVNNLGAYVRPEYRDITYFYGIDFHQDLIDYPDREADFPTL